MTAEGPRFKLGQKVRYHSIIGRPHDGDKYTITHACYLAHQDSNGCCGVVYWLKGKPGFVPEEALSIIRGQDETQDS